MSMQSFHLQRVLLLDISHMYCVNSVAAHVLSDASNTGRSHLTPPKAAMKAEVPVPSLVDTSKETTTFQRRTQVSMKSVILRLHHAVLKAATGSTETLAGCLSDVSYT